MERAAASSARTPSPSSGGLVVCASPRWEADGPRLRVLRWRWRSSQPACTAVGNGCAIVVGARALLGSPFVAGALYSRTGLLSDLLTTKRKSDGIRWDGPCTRSNRQTCDDSCVRCRVQGCSGCTGWTPVLLGRMPSIWQRRTPSGTLRLSSLLRSRQTRHMGESRIHPLLSDGQAASIIWLSECGAHNSHITHT